MKLRADFVIEIEVDDFVAAADHQRRLENLLKDIRSQYDQVRFSFNERRVRSTGHSQGGSRPSRTGNLHEYEED